jgi:lipoprotein-releasing system ATP-binding protein
MNEVIFNCVDLNKTYHDANTAVEVLKGINFTVKKGDLIAIVGPSGSGKSSLLHLLGGLDNPSAGQSFIEGVDWQALSERKRCSIRNEKLGFIYQFHHLLPEFSAMENVVMPLLMRKMKQSIAKEQAMDMLDKVGLSHRFSHKPSQLSGGERQRVAIARALVHKPVCVLADEPTGNLDNATAAKVFELMLELNQRLNTALVIVTHDQHLAQKMNQVLSIQDGVLR